MRASVRQFPWPGVLMLLLSAAFLTLNMGWLNMHADEELSYESTEAGDLIGVLQYQIDLKDNEPPAFFLAFRGWRTAAGDTEFAGRAFGILTSLMALAMVFRMAHDGFADKRAAPLALLVLIGNGLFFNYALDIRPYPLVMLTAAFSMWMLQRWLKRPVRGRLLWYGLSIALMLYTHYLLLFAVAAQLVFAAAALKLRRNAILQLALALGIGLALFLPWMPVMLSHIQHLRDIEAASGTGRGIAGIGVSTNATTPENILRLLNLASNGLFPIYLLIMAGGAFFLYRNRNYWLALVWALFTPAVYLIVNLVAGVYAPRYVAHLTLGVGLALGAALALLPTIRRIPLPWLAAGALALMNLAAFPAQIEARIPYRDIFQTLSAQAQAGDVIVFSQTDPNENLLRWQRGLYLRPDLPLVSAAEAGRAQRVWFITANLFDEAAQAEFAALEATHPVQQALGDCTVDWCFVAQLMEAPPLDEALRFGGANGLDFRGLTLDGVSGERIEARLWWQSPAGEMPPPVDYSISLYLRDAPGNLAAQADGPIQHYGSETVQTSQMEPGRLYMDVRRLELPADLPPGDYSLAVAVYQSWDGVRLLLGDGSDAYAGPTVTIR